MNIENTQLNVTTMIHSKTHTAPLYNAVSLKNIPIGSGISTGYTGLEGEKLILTFDGFSIDTTSIAELFTGFDVINTDTLTTEDLIVNGKTTLGDFLPNSDLEDDFLQVNCDTSFSSNVIIGSVDEAGSLISGTFMNSSTFSTTLDVSIEGSMSVSSIHTQGLVVSGLTNLSGNVSLGTVTSLDVTNDVSIGGDLNVSGSTIVLGDSNTNIAITGEITELNVSVLGVAGTLNVGASTSILGDMMIGTASTTLSIHASVPSINVSTVSAVSIETTNLIVESLSVSKIVTFPHYSTLSTLEAIDESNCITFLDYKNSGEDLLVTTPVFSIEKDATLNVGKFSTSQPNYANAESRYYHPLSRPFIDFLYATEGFDSVISGPGQVKCQEQITAKTDKCIVYTHVPGIQINGGSGSDAYAIISRFSKVSTGSVKMEAWNLINHNNTRDAGGGIGTIQYCVHNLVRGDTYNLDILTQSQNASPSFGDGVISSIGTGQYGRNASADDTITIFGPVTYCVMWL